MTYINETDVEVVNELIHGLRQYGVQLGERTKYLFEHSPTLGKNVNVLIMASDIEKLRPHLPAQTRFIMKLGTPAAGITGNTLIMGAGVYTGGRSAINFSLTNSATARSCYAMSLMCSTFAVVSGGGAVLAKACNLSNYGLVSEGCGYTFMKLGEMAHVAALHAEGKPIPPHLQSRNFRPPKLSRGSAYDGKYTGFVMPGGGFGLSEIIEKIPFQKVGQVVGIAITAYSYYKIVIVGYRYSQKLITKYKENRKQIKFENKVFVQARYLAVSFYPRPFVQKYLLMNRFIINNPGVYLG